MVGVIREDAHTVKVKVTILGVNSPDDFIICTSSMHLSNKQLETGRVILLDDFGFGVATLSEGLQVYRNNIM